MKSLPGGGAVADRTIAGLLRRGSWCWKDVQDARGGPPPPGAGHRCCHRLCRNTWTQAHRGTHRRLRGRPASKGELQGHHSGGDGSRSRPGPTTPGRSRGRVGSHQRPRLTQREALGRHRGTPRRRHHRDHDRERATPGIAQRRGLRHHRHTAARNRARCCRTAGAADRAGRHDAGGAAATAGARQRLRAGQGRRRPRQLLPGRKSHRAPRARTALGRRQGRRATRQVSRRPQHRLPLGDPRAGGRRTDGRARGRHVDPPGRPYRGPHQGS